MAMDRYLREQINLGKNIRAVRKAAGLTQLDIEVRTGIDRADISKIENGKKNIELYTIVKLAEAMEAELHQFFPKKQSNKQ
ncbi:helix-turn-helix transcriptional regulator [Chitinophaga oryzae]|uniref:Helix-turn-helix transcriptional regulator n=2 Tax=Chitinophaga oryzae TaxID=2725414 RepID=A0ABX6LF79_9BACT|nr:helix-turn-helix transcriptional regulator [Chitinophaga oryzae]